MNRTRVWWLTLSALVLAGALLIGCGGGSSTSTTAARNRDAESVDDSEHAVPAPSGAGAKESLDDATTPRVAVVKTMTPDPVKVVVDTNGMTVYEFRRDNPMIYEFSGDPAPTCYDACSVTWMPLLTDDAPKAIGGADSSMLGTIKRRDGGIQVTYDGHPLYLFAKDRRPGELNGQDVLSFGAGWHAVERDGDELIVAGR